MSTPLQGLKVLEYSNFIAGPYCAKLLADMGALITKVEVPGRGDPARSYGPFPEDIPDLEKSGLFFFLGTDKRSITLDPSSFTGRELFLRLASNTDILIEDSGPAAMQALGLDYQSLKAINPGLVFVSITPYGQHGPKAHWKASHINSFHASGEGYTLPGGVTHTLFPERGPVAAGVHLNQSQSEIYMDSAIRTGLGTPEEPLCPCLQGGLTTVPDFFRPVDQPGEEVSQLFLDRGFGAQAQVRGDLFARPVPDRLGSIEIRTIPRQAHQPKAQAGGSQVGTHGVTMMGWSVVPDYGQWSGILTTQLLQEGGGGLGVAVSLQFHNLHLAGLEAHRRIIAGLFAPPEAARIYQYRLSFEHPVGVQR